MPSGKLLGYMVSHHEIDPNPEKISAIMNMKPPQSLPDVQKLTGCMAALSRFIHTRRPGAPLLQVSQEARQVPMDQGSARGLRGAQRIPNYSAHSRGSRAPQSSTALLRCYA
jgi:hypothetical protein